MKNASEKRKAGTLSESSIPKCIGPFLSGKYYLQNSIIFRIYPAAVIKSCLFHILKRCIVFFPCSYLYNSRHVINKNLSIPYMPGIQSFLCSLDYRINRNPADYDLHFHFGKQVGVKRYASVFFFGSFLDSASHYLRHCDSRYTQCIQCRL